MKAAGRRRRQPRRRGWRLRLDGPRIRSLRLVLGGGGSCRIGLQAADSGAQQTGRIVPISLNSYATARRLGAQFSGSAAPSRSAARSVASLCRQDIHDRRDDNLPLATLQESWFVLMMSRQSAPPEIAAMVLSAPTWAKVAITVLDELLCERFALELGRIIAGDDGRPDNRRLSLL